MRSGLPCEWRGVARLTRDTVAIVASVTIRDLRNHGGEVVDRVAAGEHVTVTRAGKPVAELRPIRGGGLSSSVLLERWRWLPPMDPAALRRGIDALVDPAL
jgi:prevent-host-death family protein